MADTTKPENPLNRVACIVIGEPLYFKAVPPVPNIMRFLEEREDG